jgi:DNA-binding PadR family transcriptional regulator
MGTPALTPLDLLVLGLLQERPMHGYELYQLIKAERIDRWFNISMPGVYYALGKLRDRGYVSEIRQRRGSVDKAIYLLTEAGQQAFFEALEAHAAGHVPVHFDYDLSIYLLNRLPIERALALMEQRMESLRQWQMQVRETMEQEPDLNPRLRAIFDHTLRFITMERMWMGELIESIQGNAGALEAPGKRGLMVMAGDLRQYHLPDLLRLIASGKHSGTLTVTDGVLGRAINFVRGQPNCIAGYRLDQAEATPPSMEDSLRAVFDLFRWQAGEFTFDQSQPQHQWCIPIQLTTTQLILEGCRWVDNWETIRRLVSSPEAVFEVSMGEEELEQLGLTETEKAFLKEVDGSRDITDIAGRLQLTLFEASRIAYTLLAVGAIRYGDMERIHLRRAFREIAELNCRGTLVLRKHPSDTSCEQAVNRACQDIPIRIESGHIVDETPPDLELDKLAHVYRTFLSRQIEVIRQYFGMDAARELTARTLRQLVPELQAVAERYGFIRILHP